MSILYPVRWCSCILLGMGSQVVLWWVGLFSSCHRELSLFAICLVFIFLCLWVFVGSWKFACAGILLMSGGVLLWAGVLLMVICSSTQGALHCTDLGYSVRCLCMSMQEDCGAWPVGLWFRHCSSGYSGKWLHPSAKCFLTRMARSSHSSASSSPDQCLVPVRLVKFQFISSSSVWS